MRHQDPKSCFFFFFFLVLYFSCFFHFSCSKIQNILERGSYLSAENKDSDLLTSPDNSFTCGFYGVGTNAYWFAIWFTDSKEKTVVWTANRDKPVNAKGSKLTLRNNGVMVLIDVDGTNVWETNSTSTGARKAELLNTGNLVLRDEKNDILWQSFNFPTDTLLPFQILRKGNKLISSAKKQGFSSGYFNFYFDSDNVLRLLYDGPEITSLYWPNIDQDLFQNGRTNYNSSRIAVLDDKGGFLSSDQFHFNASDAGFGIKRRLTMDYDGNLRLYSLNNTTKLWYISWQALAQKCNVHGVCGRNGICNYKPKAMCSCPPGYEVRDSSDWNGGCKPKFSLSTCLRPEEVKFVELPYTDYYGFDLGKYSPISFEACRNICSSDCQCRAFSYRLTGEGICYPKGVLFNGVETPSFPGSIYLKLPVGLNVSGSTLFTGSDAVCKPSDLKVQVGSPSMYDIQFKRVRWVYLHSFVIAIGAIEFLIIVSGWWFLFRKNDSPSKLEDGYLLISSQFRGFSYSELKKATNNFKEELGRGGSGAVYKGNLTDGRVVAVKQLEGIFQGDEEFLAELSTIGKINHMNLVQMWGFCSEGKHRLLVYEYIQNLSLNTHLFTSDNFLGWKERFKVALGTAKGLAYLHHECLEWVIHCDVKPENILLDTEFEAKIADFGLAKLSQRGMPNSEFSRIRGTKGYMAPEWALNLPITAKVDVYSYGVLILEIVKGTRLSNWIVDENHEPEAEFTRFVRTVKRNIVSGNESWLEETIDQRLGGNYNKNQVKALVDVGLSCVEEDRNKRPTMDSVVQILLDCEDEQKSHTPNKY